MGVKHLHVEKMERCTAMQPCNTESFGSEARSLQEVPARKARLQRGATTLPPAPPPGQQEAAQVQVKHTKIREQKGKGAEEILKP